LFGDHTANGLYGAFTSLVYLTPLIGGLLADRYLGSKRSVKLGALLMAIGYFGLCFGGDMAKPKMTLFESPDTATSQSEVYDVKIVRSGEETHQHVAIDGVTYEVSGDEQGNLILTAEDNPSAPARTVQKGMFHFNGERNPFWVNILFLSLACVIVGNGFFKPNISTIVGSLYPEGDRRRDAGFTIFYMGINLGSMLSQFLCPFLAERYGWWAGFLLAAIGMLCAWSLFQFDGGRLAGYGEAPSGTTKTSYGLIYLGALGAIPLMWFLIHNAMVSAEVASTAAREGTGIIGYLVSLPLLGKILFALFFVATIGIPIWAYFAGTREEAEKMVVAVVLVVFSVVFWTLFEQAGSSLTLFADRNTDRLISIFGWSYNMPAAQVQIFNPLFIVLLAPVFSWLWVSLAKRHLEPSIPVKFAIALMMVGFGFLVLVFGARFVDSEFRVGLSWLVLAYLIHSIGELCLSPVGLSMITKLSIARVVGLMMGVWFLSSSMAQYVGGIVAQFAAVETVGGEVTNPERALKTYVDVFQTIGLSSIGFGIALLVLSPLLKRMMHGVR
jgi:POT family proton-dependent oligopeptide transporter